MSSPVRVSAAGKTRVPALVDRPDLQTQFEDLLNQVWLSEREWTLDDRIALSQRLSGGHFSRTGR